MKAVILRVNRTKVRVDDKVVGQIEKGLFLLLGISQKDTKESADKLAEKLAKLRIIADKDGKMNFSIKDKNLPIIVVSQFTLYADTNAGNRPSFIKAASPKNAKVLYNYFVEKLKSLDIKVETGSFGEYMNIEASLDGPVTIIIEQ